MVSHHFSVLLKRAKMGKTHHVDEDGTAAGDNYNLSSLESFFADVYLFGCATKAVLPADT